MDNNEMNNNTTNTNNDMNNNTVNINNTPSNNFYQNNTNNTMESMLNSMNTNSNVNTFQELSQDIDNNINTNIYQSQTQNVDNNNNFNVFQPQNIYNNNNFNVSQPQNINNNSSTYKLILNRKKAFVASLVTFKVFIDDAMVGTIKNGQTLTLDVTPGKHVVAINNNNPTDIIISCDTTADVVVFGANSFGISNINGGSNVNPIDDNDLLPKCEKRTSANLIVSIILPILSVGLYLATDHKYVLQFWFYGILVGYGIVNLSGLKNIQDHNSPAYKSLLIKNIISIVISIISIIVTIYITNIGL